MAKTCKELWIDQYWNNIFDLCMMKSNPLVKYFKEKRQMNFQALRSNVFCPFFVITEKNFWFMWQPYFFDKSIVEVPVILCFCKVWINGTSVKWDTFLMYFFTKKVVKIIKNKDVHKHWRKTLEVFCQKLHFYCFLLHICANTSLLWAIHFFV